MPAIKMVLASYVLRTGIIRHLHVDLWDKPYNFCLTDHVCELQWYSKIKPLISNFFQSPKRQGLHL